MGLLNLPACLPAAAAHDTVCLVVVLLPGLILAPSSQQPLASIQFPCQVEDSCE